MANIAAVTKQVDDSKQIIVILMEEYKLHANELVVQIQLYHKQTEFIQLYATFLVSLLAYLTGRALTTEGTSTLSQIKDMVPWPISMLLLVIGSSVLFYLVSAAMSSSYIFLILRRRMGEIEDRINKIVGENNLLKYERLITRTFLEQSYYARGAVAPHLLSGVFRVFMHVSVTFLLVFLSGRVLPQGPAFFYTWTVLFVGMFLVVEYVRLYSSKGRQRIDEAYKTPDVVRPALVLRYPISGAVNYLAVISLLYFYMYGGLGEWLKNTAIVVFGPHAYALPPLMRGLSITIYTFLAGTVLPTPSEAPILMFRQDSIMGILAASAIGKGLSATLIVWLVVSGKLKLPNQIKKFVPSIEGNKKGWLLYFLCQAIPFLPMRSSTILLGAVNSRRSAALKAGLICAGATVIRMLLMFGLISLGAVATTYIVHTLK